MRTKEQFGAFMPRSEKELIAAAARGEAAAFGEIYRRYGGRVYDFAYRMLGVRSVAEDVTHEAFVALMRHPARYQAEREFSPEDAELGIEGYDLWRNGQSVYKDDEGATKGRFIWIDIPRVGRVILTLASPPEDSGFQRAAVVGDHQIIFTIGADQYEWLSPQRIAPGSGVYHLWMRLDPTFSFPIPKQKTGSQADGWEIGSASDIAQKPKKE